MTDHATQAAPTEAPTPVPDAATASLSEPQRTTPQQPDGAAAVVKRDPVPFVPTNADEMFRYARMLAGSSLLPRSFYDRDDRERKQPRIADVHFVLVKGQALGLHPMTAIGNINVIDGKAEIGAALMVALCLKSGLCEYFDLVATDDAAATFAAKRVGGRREIRFTYTMAMAERLGIATKDNWRRQPDTMLRRRCQSMLAREVFPDVVMGLYDHDELAEMRERERALGIDPDRVIPEGGMASTAQPADAAPMVSRLPEPTRRQDPLKERLQLRRAAQADGAPIFGHGEVSCAGCGVPVLGTAGAKCEACLNS